MQKEQLETLVTLGLSQEKISVEIEVSKGTVAYYMKKFGIKAVGHKIPNRTCVCTECKISFERGRTSTGKYCSLKCQHAFQSSALLEAWKLGKVKGYSGETKQICPWLRRYLLEKWNYSCVKCGWNKRHPIDNLPLVEINHIDGDAENCIEENLEVICPNCHSETHNFRARNKDSKRNRK